MATAKGLYVFVGSSSSSLRQAPKMIVKINTPMYILFVFIFSFFYITWFHLLFLLTRLHEPDGGSFLTYFEIPTLREAMLTYMPGRFSPTCGRLTLGLIQELICLVIHRCRMTAFIRRNVR